MRYDIVGAHSHSVCKALGIKMTEKWYALVWAGMHTHKSQYVNMKMLWNKGVHTDREVMTNRLYIIIKNTKEKTCVLRDVAIPVDRNVTQKEKEKKLKHNSLCI
jgi:hypothetical protein